MYERLNLTEFDFKVQNEGSIVILHPCNDAAREWISENIYDDAGRTEVQWWGGGIVIEPRYVQDILDGITGDGLTVSGLVLVPDDDDEDKNEPSWKEQYWAHYPGGVDEHPDA